VQSAAGEEEPVAPKQLCVVCGKEIPYRPSGSGVQLTKCCSKECSYERHKWRQKMYLQRKKERMMEDGKI
jgi:predicted nucleic acid-binding Zn ribbon protein